MFKKIISTAAAFTLAAGLVCPQFSNADIALTSFAEAAPTSGFCGAEGNEENVTWSFDETTGTLTISGMGEMEDYIFGGPWCNYDITEIIIENGVTSIGNWAFEECSSLTSIIISDSVTRIGDDAFWGCSNLSSITIPDSVTYIGEGIFENCSSLTSIIIPDSVTSIGRSAFEGCSSLESVTIPNGITSIGKWAFEECISLESVIIENPDCEIDDDPSTFSNGRDDNYDYYFEGTIYGYEGSTAQKYAEEYEFNFGNLSKMPIPSEATAESVPETTTNDLIDASVVLQEYALLATGHTGDLTPEQTNSADVNADGSVDSSDASTILRYYAYTATGGKDPFDVFLKS